MEYRISYEKGHTRFSKWHGKHVSAPWVVDIVITDEDAQAGLCSGATRYMSTSGSSKYAAMRSARTKARDHVKNKRRVAAYEQKGGVIRERL